MQDQNPPEKVTAGLRADQATGGGTASTLADSARSQPQTAHACRTGDRPKSSAARCGSGLARASSQSSTYSPSPAFQRAAAGDSVAVANSSRAGIRVREESCPRVASTAGPPADFDLLGVPRVTHDDVAGRGLCRQTGEQAHRQAGRAPPRVDGCRAPAERGAQRGQDQRRAGRRCEISGDAGGVVGRVLIVHVQRGGGGGLRLRGKEGGGGGPGGAAPCPPCQSPLLLPLV